MQPAMSQAAAAEQFSQQSAQAAQVLGRLEELTAGYSSREPAKEKQSAQAMRA